MSNVTISGTSDLDDTLVVSSIGDNNFGASTYSIGGNNTNGAILYHAFLRIATSAIPAGNYTLARLDTKSQTNRVGQATGNLYAYRILAANDWVEGTKNNAAAAAGETTWNNCKHSSQAWAGSAGCSTSGTDFAADAAGLSYPIPANLPNATAIQLPMDPDFFTSWEAGDYANEGVVFISDNESTTSLVQFNTTEHGTPSSVYAEYTEPAAGAIFFGANF